MGTSTNGEISFGYVFEDGFEFPWDKAGYVGDIESWWLAINGYKPPFELYTENGEYAPGFSSGDPRISEYYDHRREWMDSHPIPVALVNYCSGDYPMYAMVVPSVGLSCRRGYPERFDPSDLLLSLSVERIESLISFCQTHGIETQGEPRWLLTSYWG